MTVTQVTPASSALLFQLYWSYVVLLFNIFKNNDTRRLEMFNSDLGQIVKIGCNDSRNEERLCLI